MGNSYSIIIASLRDMEDDFGVIPTPKLDEGQEHYYSYVNTWCLGGIAVPITCQNTDMTGLLSEVLCYLSYRDVRPVLYESVMKTKVARDSESARMLDIIFDTTYLDYNGIMDFGGSATAVSDAIYGKAELVSKFASIQKAMDTALTEFQAGK